jgi:hypothetical protein
MGKLRGWSRRHVNGWYAEVRESPGRDRARFHAFAIAPAGDDPSLHMADSETEPVAKMLADRLAHAECENPEGCAGSWVEFSSE